MSTKDETTMTTDEETSNEMFPIEDWKVEVMHDNTRLGYEDWKQQKTDAYHGSGPNCLNYDPRDE